MSQIQSETNLVSQFLAFVIVVLNIFVFSTFQSAFESKGCFCLEITRYLVIMHTSCIRSDQAFQLLEQLTIAAGYTEIPYWLKVLKGKVSYCRLVRNGKLGRKRVS